MNILKKLIELLWSLGCWFWGALSCKVARSPTIKTDRSGSSLPRQSIVIKISWRDTLAWWSVLLCQPSKIRGHLRVEGLIAAALPLPSARWRLPGRFSFWSFGFQPFGSSRLDFLLVVFVIVFSRLARDNRFCHRPSIRDCDLETFFVLLFFFLTQCNVWLGFSP